MYHVLVDEAILSEIVRRLVEAIDPDKIILFGSRARGDTHAQSDVDLLIVRPSEEPRHRRVGRAHRALIGIGVPIDVLWYTPEEAEECSGAKHHIASRAMREGQLLYERKR
jgi:predicted nucleotidyltransferase